MEGRSKGSSRARKQQVVTLEQPHSHAGLGQETWDALLYGQLYAALRYDLMRAPAVSGCQDYKALCVAAKGEERRLIVLKQRQQFEKPTPSARQHQPPEKSPHMYSRPSKVVHAKAPAGRVEPPRPAGRGEFRQQGGAESRKCYQCGRNGRLAKDCKTRKSESNGRSTPHPSQAKQVQSHGPTSSTNPTQETVDFLFSSSDDEADVRAIRVSDKGSISQCVKVQLQGVPVYGLIDSGADISIIGGTLFRKIATAARLKKNNFHKPDKVPRTYDRKPFHLDGRMELDTEFDGKELRTSIYVKMDAHDQLLLSEGVCRQLGIINYHDKVERWRGGRKSQAPSVPVERKEAKVPAVRVNLVQSVHLLPHQSVMVAVQVQSKEVVGPTAVEASRDGQRCPHGHCPDRSF